MSWPRSQAWRTYHGFTPSKVKKIHEEHSTSPIYSSSVNRLSSLSSLSSSSSIQQSCLSSPDYCSSRSHTALQGKRHSRSPTRHRHSRSPSRRSRRGDFPSQHDRHGHSPARHGGHSRFSASRYRPLKALIAFCSRKTQFSCITILQSHCGSLTILLAPPVRTELPVKRSCGRVLTSIEILMPWKKRKE